MDTEQIEIVVQPIPAEDYLRLVVDVGWKRFVNPEAVETALANSTWSAVAVDREKDDFVVGAVRVVGDGAIFFYIQDLMVMKAYRKRGIGRALMEAANDYLKQETPRKSYVGLFTHPTKTAFYEKFGFNGPRPSLVGMYKTTKT
ncbi:MAG: GNAT family N-acetyltransferase [Caldilineaceae bacterium]